MQKVAFYEISGFLTEQIRQMTFWQKHSNFFLLDTVQTEYALQLLLQREHPDVLILVYETQEISFWEEIRRIKEIYRSIRLIVIGHERSYEAVREAFLSGVFDYLVQPLREEELEQTFLRMYDVLGLSYTVTHLYMKMDALVEHLFAGGGKEEEMIHSMICQIYRDWAQDEINCQMVADKTKYRMYEKMISERPWLKKLLCRKDFENHSTFVPKNMEDIIDDWMVCFQNVKKLLYKYRLMEDRQIGRIAVWIMEHSDVKVTLESVAAGVYMNPSYVSHIFKKTSGFCLSDYIAEVKTDRAKVLLRDEDMKTADVAAALGYSSVEYFSRVFRKKTGVTPAAWQKDRMQRN